MKKALKQVNSKYKETFTRSNKDHEPKDHHVASIIILLMIIVVLLCGVVFFLLQQDAKKTELLEELVVQSANDYSYYMYSTNEFAQKIGNEVTLKSMEDFLFEQEFEEIGIENNEVKGRKALGCYDDMFKGTSVCRIMEVSYTSGDEYVEVGINRHVFED